MMPNFWRMSRKRTRVSWLDLPQPPLAPALEPLWQIFRSPELEKQVPFENQWVEESLWFLPGLNFIFYSKLKALCEWGQYFYFF